MPTGDELECVQADDIWEGMTDADGNLIEPPDDDTTAVTRSERAAVDVSEFWNARPVLRHLHDYARAQRVGPWAVFGSALARIICQTSHDVQLPATVASFASLNMFVGLVGESGDGKDGAQDVAADAVWIEHERFKVSPLGSGEGLAHMFMRQGRSSKEDPNPEPVQYNTSALVTVGEIDTLGSLVQRQSSTVTSQLRQAAMGQALGFFYADSSRRMIVPQHQYRLCLIAGIQPTRSGVLLNDSEGGTPQRFVWLPAGDPGAQYDVPDAPTPLVWQAPDWGALAPRAHSRGQARWLVTLPDITRETIINARVGRLRGDGEKLDSHAILTRTKVAAALAIMDGRCAVEVADWELSGVVMAVSDAQRARCLQALMREKEKVTMAKALEEADRSLVVEDRIDRTRVTKCSESARRLLLMHGPLTGSELRRRLKSTHRPHLEAALDALALSGEVEAEKLQGKGNTSGYRYSIIRK